MNVSKNLLTNVTQWQTAQTLLAHTNANVVLVLQEMGQIVQVWKAFKTVSTLEKATIL